MHPDLALERILSGLGPLGSVCATLGEAAGRVLAEDLAARRRLPGFDRAVQGGFAVSTADVEAAALDAPVRLSLRDRLVVADGDEDDVDVLPGGAVALAPGAPLPEGADAVLAAGEAEADGGVVRVLSPARPGARVERRGAELLAGELLLARGRRLRVCDLPVLALQGYERVPVFALPRVRLLAADGDPNGVAAAAGVVRRGGLAQPSILSEHPDGRLDDAGSWDVTVILPRSASLAADVDQRLRREGLDPLVDALDIAPDGSFLFGRLRGRPVWRLSPAPAAAWIQLEEFVFPAVERLRGEERGRAALTGTLACDVAKEPARRSYLWCEASQGPNGWALRPLRSNGAYDLAAIRSADALAWAPLGPALLRAGSALSFHPLD